MIVARIEGRLRIVLQVDHQLQCATAAEAWGNDLFTRLESWDDIVRAAAVHDEGWREWESAPEVDASGAPVDFPALDRGRHIALYRHGIDMAFREGPRVGLLVSMHGEGLYRARLGLDGPPPDPAELREPLRGFVTEEHARQQRARSELGAGVDRWAWDGYRLLQAWDMLSLYLLWRALPAMRPGVLRSVPVGRGDAGVDVTLEPVDAGTVACDPFPFTADEVELPVAARTISDRRYASHEELRTALDRAPVERSEFRVIRRSRPHRAAGRR